MTWWKYVQWASAGATQEQIARKVDVSTPSVGRWKTSKPHPENVATFARAYGRPVLEAFIAAGFLTPEEADEKPSAPPSLASLSDEELLDAVRARMKGERDGRQPEPEKSGRVIELPARGDGQQTWAANETGEPPETDAE